MEIKKGQHGGYRPGAGRKKQHKPADGALVKSAALKKAESKKALVRTVLADIRKDAPTGERKSLKATSEEVRAIALEYCPEIIRGYGEIWRDETLPLPVRQSAAKEIMERGLGKAAQPVNHGDNEGNALIFEGIDSDQLNLAVARLAESVEALKVREAHVPAGRDEGAGQAPGAPVQTH